MSFQEFHNEDSSTTPGQPQPDIPSTEIHQQSNIQRTPVLSIGPPPYTENVRIQPRLLQPSLNQFHGRAQRTKKMGNFSSYRI